MAFLVFRTRIRAHGTTSARECAAAATVLFHPDFNRRLRNRTESADPCFFKKQGARGLGPFGPYRRWGLSPRPENIGRPPRTAWRELCPRRGAPASAIQERKAHIRHDGRAIARPQADGDSRLTTLTIVAKRAFDSDSFQSLTAAANSVVDGARIVCGRTLGAVARIPQITSLEPRKLRLRPV